VQISLRECPLAQPDSEERGCPLVRHTAPCAASPCAVEGASISGTWGRVNPTHSPKVVFAAVLPPRCIVAGAGGARRVASKRDRPTRTDKFVC